MKTLRLTSLAAALGSAILISSAFAQENTVQGPANTDTDGPDYGTLGHTYMNIGASLVDFRNVNSAPTGYGSELKFNIETTDNFDIGFGYGFNHGKNTTWSLTNQGARLWTTGFYKFKAIAPYVSAGGGYDWQRTFHTVGKTTTHERFNSAIYDLASGVEIPVFSQASVRVGANYEASLRRPHPTQWTYQTAFDYNFDENIGLDTGVDLLDGRKGYHDALAYHLGFRYTFD